MLHETIIWHPEDFPGWQAARELHAELTSSRSDRAVAILAVGLLEQRMAQAFRSQLIDDKKAADEILGVGRSLSHIGTLANLVYLMGWFGTTTYEDIRLLINVRHLFAHRPHLPNGKGISQVLSFETPGIKSKCMSLKLPMIFRTPLGHDIAGKSMDELDESDFAPTPKTSREMFIRSAVLVCNFLSNQFAPRHPVFHGDGKKLP
jgi:hypothetical protein